MKTVYLFSIILICAPLRSQNLTYTPPAQAAFLSANGTSWSPWSSAAAFGALSYSPPAIGLYCQASAGAAWTPCAPSSGSGTVTSFSSGNLAPLFTTSVTNSTTTPAQTFTPSTAPQNSVLAGPATGGAGAYSFQIAPTFSAANLTNVNAASINGLAVPASATVIGSNSSRQLVDNSALIPTLAANNIFTGTTNTFGNIVSPTITSTTSSDLSLLASSSQNIDMAAQGTLIIISSGVLGPGSDNSINSASVSNRWANIYAVNGLFSNVSSSALGSSTLPICTTTGGLFTNSNCAFGPGASATITVAAGAGTGGTAACASSYVCTSRRGRITVVTGTLPATGSIATVTTTLVAGSICTAVMNGGAAFLGIGAGSETSSGFSINAGVTIAGTVTIDYSCATP